MDTSYQDTNEKLKGLQAESSKIKSAVYGWNMRCSEDMRITTNERQEFLSPLRKRQTELEHEISKLSKEDDKFEIALNALLDLASRSYQLFKSSRPEEKQEILKLLFSNLLIDGKNLQFY
ncbi:MAG: hypothetical protein JJW01_02705 [Alphaproteobacteria bacterium]|nr:hypothetical protein [Rickettsiales bacterium]